MDITLDDLLVLEPRLRLARWSLEQPGASPAMEKIGVSWAVSARLTAPHLPALRGGEVLIIPPKVASELSAEMPALLREASQRQVSAIVSAPEAVISTQSGDVRSLPMLEWGDDLTDETETSVNRRLTECRGELYRIGSELERNMADLAVSHSGISALATVAATALGLPVSVLDANGRILASSDEEAQTQSATTTPATVSGEVRRELAGRATLILGPFRPEQRVVARFLADRVAVAAVAALKRDEAAKPRGPRRIEATQALLSGQCGNASEQRATALALGLDPDAVFFVAISRGEHEAALARALAPLGIVHPAGGTNGRRAVLVAANSRTSTTNLSHRVADIKRRWETDHARDGATLAVSAPALGVASLPSAAREARFVASLQSQAAFPKRAVSFESVDDIGAMRLLYHLRDSSELRKFVAEALGALQNRDQRGTLRATLRAFLESGGSQVDASHRLGIHRNTLAYRLRRIGELVGRDVADPASWLTLHLALRASEMLELSADDRS
jgi:hypothetical protein